MTARTRWIALVVLLGIWAGVGVWVFTESPEPQLQAHSIALERDGALLACRASGREWGSAV